jgi:hypothetical protein
MAHSISYRRMLTRLGYYNYQNGLIYRLINQEAGWESHLKNCRRVILKALEIYKPGKVTVLGSGWLLDLPLAELVESTTKICLVDIVHPPDVIRQVKAFRNVELIEQDVTGGLIEQIWNKRANYNFFNPLPSLKDIIVPEYKQEDDPGMVISLNILTQLESLLVRFVNKRSKIKEEGINIFRKEIQKKHIDFLNKHKSVLISDYAEVITNRLGSIKTIPTLLADLPPYQLKEEWTWKFDQTGADLYNCKSQFKVFGLIN